MERDLEEFTINPVGAGNDLLEAAVRMLPVLQNWLDRNYPNDPEQREFMQNRLIWECLLDEQTIDLGKNAASEVGFSLN